MPSGAGALATLIRHRKLILIIKTLTGGYSVLFQLSSLTPYYKSGPKTISNIAECALYSFFPSIFIDADIHRLYIVC